jgi:hypothetical protein
MAASEEHAVAQFVADILAGAAIADLPPIVTEGSSAAITLPNTLVAAEHQGEEQAIQINGTFGGHYQVAITLRALRTEPADSVLDAFDAAIGQAMKVMPSQIPASGSVFDYFCIDLWTGEQSDSETEVRTRRRLYSVFVHFR